MNRDRDAPYFLGSIVLIKEEDNPRSEVVDGQQRLTTLTMLLCVLRDIANDSELDVFVRQAGIRRRRTEDRFRLSVRYRDQQFFQDNVQEMNSLEDFLKLDPVDFSDSQRLLFENVGHLKHSLLKLGEEDRDRLADYIVQQCFLVVVSASDGDSAHRIFSVMNNRGLDLSPTDVLKAVILDAIPDPGSQDEYAVKWENAEEELGRDDFRDLFAHIRMIHRKEKLRDTLEKEFQQYVLGGLDFEGATSFVDDQLDPYADVYETVSRASYESTEGAESVNASLRHLNRLDNFDWIPSAMFFFYREKGDTERLIKFSRDLERLAYGLFIRRANINERIDRYAQVLSTIEHNDGLFDESSPLQLTSGEKEEIVEKLDRDIYSQLRLRMPLLLRLDSVVADAEATYQYPVISVEHVLPQSPSEESQWMEWFPDEEERTQWTHRLANLVLLSRRRNARASNYEFERKKSEYFQRNGTTSFALTTKVVDESEWTPAVLERRQRELIGALKKEWRL